MDDETRRNTITTAIKSLNDDGLPLTTVLLAVAESARRAKIKVDPDVLTQIILESIEHDARANKAVVQQQRTFTPIPL